MATAKKEAAAKTKGGETVKLTAGDVAEVGAEDLTTGKPAEKPRRKALTNAQLIAAYRVQGGKCYVTGADLGDDTADVDGKLVTNAVKKYAGQRGLEGLRDKLIGDLTEAQDLVAAYGKLASAHSGYVTFAGEAASEKAPA